MLFKIIIITLLILLAPIIVYALIEMFLIGLIFLGKVIDYIKGDSNE